MVRLGRLTALCIETDLKTSAYFAFRLLERQGMTTPPLDVGRQTTRQPGAAMSEQRREEIENQQMDRQDRAIDQAVDLTQPEPSRLLCAASTMFRPSLAMAASRGDSPESRRDSGRSKLVLECSFANSPRSTKVGF